MPNQDLRPNKIPNIKKERLPKVIVVFDTESKKPQIQGDVEYQYLMLIVARYIKFHDDLSIAKDFVVSYTNVSQFADWFELLSLRDKAIYVYAHNLKYDLQLSGIFQELVNRGWETKAFVLEDRPNFVRLSKNRRTIIFVDTFNYWSFSVRKMGEQIGYPKLELPGWNEDIEKWVTYCQRDVDVLAEYLINFFRFLRENDLCGLGLTIASQAFRSYRHKFMTSDIYLHSDTKVLELERKAYSGGRVECWHIGILNSQNYYKIDINSMYPFIMRDNVFPIRLVGYAENIKIERLKKLLKTYYVIANVTLQTQVNLYPTRYDNRLIFPIGRFKTSLHKPELARALLDDDIVSVEEVAIYESENIFRSYVEFFYRLKLDATRNNNPVMRQQAKLFLNSLYGKFGQVGITEEIEEITTGKKWGREIGYSESLNKRVEVVYLGDRLIRRTREGESLYSFPAIAGGVTAYARVYLYNLAEKAGLENVYYMDTDSLFINALGLANLNDYLDDEKLGYMKIEDVSNHIELFGLKDYVFGETVKHKGVPKTADKIGSNLWVYKRFLGAKTWINNGFENGVTITPSYKRRLSPYAKGVVLDNGRVLPYRLV